MLSKQPSLKFEKTLNITVSNAIIWEMHNPHKRDFSYKNAECENVRLVGTTTIHLQYQT